ncbi:oxidoreductase [Bacteroidia bacterium]|nr:oxidoreductase [Bacteroidia bacterium]
MADKTYNWGIVGAGHISRKFVDGLSDVPNGRAYAVAARDITRAQQFANEKGMPVAYGSYEALANDPNVDAVYIGTTNTEHCAHAILMLEHKKPVLCEKPFAMNREEVDKMIAAARTHHTFLMEALWTNFLPSMNAVRKIIAEGTIGDIRHIRADFGFFREYNPNDRIFNPKLGGGSVLDIGLYPIFLAVSLLGYPDRVRAEGIKSQDGVDLTASMFFEWRNGAFAQLLSSFTVNLGNGATIYGSKGKIAMHRQWHCPTRISLIIDEITTDYPVASVGNGYNYEAEEVQNCLAQGFIESPRLPLAHSAQFMSLMDTVIKQL